MQTHKGITHQIQIPACDDTDGLLKMLCLTTTILSDLLRELSESSSSTFMIIFLECHNWQGPMTLIPKTARLPCDEQTWHGELTFGTKLVSAPAPNVSMMASNSRPMSVAMSYTSTGFSGRDVAMTTGGQGPSWQGLRGWTRVQGLPGIQGQTGTGLEDRLAGAWMPGREPQQASQWWSFRLRTPGDVLGDACPTLTINFAARITSGRQKYDHKSDVLQQMNWPSV